LSCRDREGTPHGTEIWFGIGALIFIIALVYGVVRAGWLNPPERQRTDAVTRQTRRQEEKRQEMRDRTA
jgi:hypothetical protein